MGTCPGCFLVSDHILVYDTNAPYQGLRWFEILIISVACLGMFLCLILVARRLRKKRKRNEDLDNHDEIRFTESDDLMVTQLDWGGESIVI